MAALDNGKNPDIGTQKIYRGEIISECGTESFESKFLHYDNEVLFEMVKTALKDTYLEGTTTTSLQNEVSICRQKCMIERLALWSINR